MIDASSRNKIAQLHPAIRSKVEAAMNEANEALTGRAKVRLASGFRTMKEQQDLYDQGRTKPGNKVTNAKPGQSIHNYGLAVDIFLIIDGKTASWDTKADWDGDKKSDWMEVIEMFKKHGFEWGGDWVSFKDMPHFELSGYKWRDLLIKHNAGDFIPGGVYVNL